MKGIRKKEFHNALSPQDLRTIIDMSNDGILVFSEEGSILYANTTAFEFFEKRNLLGVNILELLGKGVGEVLNLLRERGDKVCQELEIKETQKIFWACFLLVQEEPKKYCVYLTDVTSRKEFEEKLRASERRYRELFEKVQEGVFISTVEGRFLDCNEAFLKMLGYTSKEELMQIFIPTDLYVNPKDREFLQQQIERYGYIKDWEVKFKRKDGSTITVLHTAHAVRDESGRIIGYEGMSVDITERKKLEEQLKDSNEFLKGIIESSPYGIIATDMKGNVLIFNKAAEELLGYKAEEVIGKKHISELYPPGMAKEVMRKLRSSGGRYSGEFEALDRYGQKIPVHLSAALVYRDGKEVASLGIFTDLRPKLEMERRLRETQLQLLQLEKLRSLGEMAAGVAHEINNPLGGILLYASLLLEELHPDDPKRVDLERIVSEATRCKEIVKSLLEFARRSSPDKEIVDVNRTINEGLLFLENQAAFLNIRIIKELDPALPKVYGNSGQLKQVFMNIILNAVDAMQGEGLLHIKTYTQNGGKEVVISFTDTGVGIPQEILPRIFDPFFTTKEVGKGTGLGLSVSYGIVREHGGRIEVESEVGKGSTFRVILPALETEA